MAPLLHPYHLAWARIARTTDAELGPVYRHVVASFVLD